MVCRGVTVLLVCGLAWTAAPDVRAADAEPQAIVALVQQLPASTTTIREDVMQELAALGPAGVEVLAGMLVEPGEGDDSDARYALHGLAIWYARSGAEAERARFARDLVTQVGQLRSPSTQRFLIRQLLWAGGQESVSELTGLILDETLGDATVHVLLAFQKGAEEPLLAALPRARGSNRLRVIQALGELRVREAVPALQVAARDPEVAVRLGALEALGNIGGRAASKSLARAVASADSPYERAKVTAAWLRLARRLAEGGDREAALYIYKKILKGRRWRKDLNVRSHALRGLAEVQGVEAMPAVLAAMKSPDPELKRAAAGIAAAIPGTEVTYWWIQQAGQGEAKTRAAVLEIMGNRGDRAALKTIQAALAVKEQPVRLAAIAAAGKLGREEAVPWLTTILADRDREARAAVKEALLHMLGEAATAAIAASLDRSPPATREALLNILASRGAFAHLSTVLRFTRDTEVAVRLAALNAVGVLGGWPALPLLVETILKTGEEPEREAAKDALVSICGRQADRDPCARLVLDALPRAEVPARCALLAALSHVGGDPALAAVREALAHESAFVKEAAVRALADWPDVSPAGDLLELVRTAPEVEHRVLALRGYVRLVGLPSQRSPEETVEMYESAMAAVPRPEGKKLVLSGLSKVGHIRALALAESHLDDPAIQAEAAAAAIKIVKGMRGTHQEKSMAVLQKILDISGAEAVHEQAGETLEYLKEYGDYIVAWLVSGPYRKEGADDADLLDTIFPPEQSNAEDAGWWWPDQDLESEEPWKVDVSYGVDGEHCVAYLRTRVWSPLEQAALLELGSDDGIKVWLNGSQVHSNNAWRGLEPGEDKVNVTLREGWNRLLLKITQGGGDWAACARFRTLDGDKLSGLRVQPE